MYPHHAESIEIIKKHFEADPDFQAAESDIDALIVLSEEEYQEHVESGNMTAVLHDFCTYEGVYVDAKYTSLGFIRQVAEIGSEPARWAFDGAKILFNRTAGTELEDGIRTAVTYPLADKHERLRRFRAQLEIWRWYTGEALRKKNKYLRTRP